MPLLHRRLILASSSKYRAQLLGRLGLRFIQQSPDIDEVPRIDERPSDLARRLAREKARAIAARNPEDWVIGSDQVASLDNIEPIGKPGSADNAVAQLQRASGRSMCVYTGISLQCQALSFESEALDCVEVQFRVLSDSQIRYYVAKERPLDCAGSVKSEALGGALLARVRSDDPSSLIGLPLIKLCDLFTIAGIDLLSEQAAFAC